MRFVGAIARRREGRIFLSTARCITASLTIEFQPLSYVVSGINNIFERASFSTFPRSIHEYVLPVSTSGYALFAMAEVYLPIRDWQDFLWLVVVVVVAPKFLAIVYDVQDPSLTSPRLHAGSNAGTKYANKSQIGIILSLSCEHANQTCKQVTEPQTPNTSCSKIHIVVPRKDSVVIAQSSHPYAS